MYSTIKEELASGGRAYIICPLVGESSSKALTDVKVEPTPQHAQHHGPPSVFQGRTSIAADTCKAPLKTITKPRDAHLLPCRVSKMTPTSGYQRVPVKIQQRVEMTLGMMHGHRQRRRSTGG